MSCFIDTSGLMAITNPGDDYHFPASGTWTRLLEVRRSLLTTNYVVVEAVALIHRRHGVAAARRVVDDILPAIDTEWIDQETHDRAMAALFASGRSGPSLVDCVSFEVMRRHGITEALAFDRHFEEQGYGLPAIP